MTERLDAHAAAIRDLRARVAALEAALAGQVNQTRPIPATFTVPATCPGCGVPKPASRAKNILCRTCGAARQAALNARDPSLMPVSCCASCSGALTNPYQPLCPTCSTKFNEWKRENP